MKEQKFNYRSSSKSIRYDAERDVTKIKWDDIGPVLVGEATKKVHSGDYIDTGLLVGITSIVYVYKDGHLVVNSAFPRIVPTNTPVRIYCPHLVPVIK